MTHRFLAIFSSAQNVCKRLREPGSPVDKAAVKINQAEEGLWLLDVSWWPMPLPCPPRGCEETPGGIVTQKLHY